MLVRMLSYPLLYLVIGFVLHGVGMDQCSNDGECVGSSHGWLAGDDVESDDKYCSDVLEHVQVGQRKYWDRKEPAVLIGVPSAANWNASAFNFQDLQSDFGLQSVGVFSSSQAAVANRLGQRRHQLREVLKIIREQKHKVYVFDEEFFRNPRAQRLVKMPKWLSMNGGHLLLALGGQGAGTQFHSHGASFLTLFFGRKRWYLQRIGTFPDASAHVLHKPVSAWKQDVLPGLKTDAPLSCVQQAGETILVPDSWGHATENLDETVGIAWQRSAVSQNVCEAGADMFCLRHKLNTVKKLSPNERLARFKQLFKDAKQLFGDSPSIFVLSSNLEEYWGESKEAAPILKEFHRLAQIQARDAKAHTDEAILAATLVKLVADIVAKTESNVTKVIKMLAPALAKAPEAGYGIDLARAYGQLGSWNQAVEQLEKHQVHFPNDEVAVRLLKSARGKAKGKGKQPEPEKVTRSKPEPEKATRTHEEVQGHTTSFLRQWFLVQSGLAEEADATKQDRYDQHVYNQDVYSQTVEMPADPGPRPGPSPRSPLRVSTDPSKGEVNTPKQYDSKSHKNLPELPKLAEVTSKFTAMANHEHAKFQLLQLKMGCTDSADAGIDCKEALLYCREDSGSGSMVRTFCPKTCNACSALKPNELTATPELRKAVANLQKQPIMTEGPRPKVSIKSTDKVSYIVVDNFLPEHVVAQTARLARESLFWQPQDSKQKLTWVLGPNGGGKGARKDANGLWAVEDGSGGFPGLQMPPDIEYSKLFWARLQSLDLPKRLSRVIDNSVKMLTASWQGNHQMVCRSPSTLHVDQTRPHVDKGQEPPALAVVHIITNWTASQAVPSVQPISGGTAFYGEKLNNGQGFFGPNECPKLQGGQGSIFCKGTLAFDCSHGNAPASRCKGVQSTQRMGREKKYISNATGDSGYTFLDGVEPKYNRAIIYSSNQLHGAFIDEAALAALSCDPTKGRVVSSFFIR